jgi:cytochrome b involved in lipid metabolism
MNRKLLLVIIAVIAGVAVWRIWFAGPRIPEDSRETIRQEQAAPTTVYTVKDLAAHATEQDCWIAISGTVYDVTAFIPSHPGGKAIVQGCGTDATALFATVPDHERVTAKAQLDAGYRIGDLAL